jgi:drug/metabolite transporter (DMT)-like permease
MHITMLSVYVQQNDVRQLTVLQIAAAAILFVAVWFMLRASAALFSMNSLPEFLVNESVDLVWNARAAWQLAYLALVATVITFLLWTWGQARTSATHAAIIFSLEPLFATAFAVAVNGEGEWMGKRGTLGAVLILAGVIISEIRLTERRQQ